MLLANRKIKIFKTWFYKLNQCLEVLTLLKRLYQSYFDGKSGHCLCTSGYIYFKIETCQNQFFYILLTSIKTYNYFATKSGSVI